MQVVDSRLCVIGLCAALIAGCGGVGTATGGGGNGGGGGGNNPTVVTLTFPNGVSLVAAQIGGGAFAAQTLSGNSLSLSIPSGTSNYAVAYVCPAQSAGLGQFTEEAVWEASTADGTSVNLNCMYGSVSTAGMGTLTGSVDATAVPGAQVLEINSQNGDSLVSAGAGGGSTANFSLPAPVGSDRVLVFAYNNSQVLVGAKNFTNQMVPGALNSGNTVVFGTADETTSGPITYNNAPSGFGSPNTYVGLQMAGTEFLVVIANQATAQYPLLPTAALISGDLYFFNASAYSTGNSSSSVSAGVSNAGGPVSLSFPPPWTYAGPTAAAQPTFNFGYTGFSGKSGVLEEGEYSWQAGSSGATPLVDGIQLTVTTSYLGGTTMLTAPNLSSLTGFLPTPASGTKVSWFADIYIPEYNFEVGDTPTLNSTWSGVSNSGSFTVP